MTAQLTSIRPRLSAYRIIRLFAGPVTALPADPGREGADHGQDNQFPPSRDQPKPGCLLLSPSATYAACSQRSNAPQRNRGAMPRRSKTSATSACTWPTITPRTSRRTSKGFNARCGRRSCSDEPSSPPRSPARTGRPATSHPQCRRVVLLGAQILLHHGDVLADLCCWHTFFNTAPNVPRPEEGHGTLQGGSAMRIGRDTKRRVDDIKEEMEQPLRQLEMYLVRLNEHAGDKANGSAA
jgi:hypothetical protein